MAAYATIADLISRRDERVIRQLATDRDEPLTHDEILASIVADEALIDASGEVEAAMIAGKRYSPDELSGLVGNSLGLLKRIVTTIAMACLYERKPGVHREIAEHYFKQAQEYLERLRTGQNLFNLADESNTNAAIPDLTAPTAVDVRNLNSFPAQMSDRYFPSLESRVPIHR
jgi:phage gp36-like protein